MGNPRRERERPPGRRKPFREPKPIILIVCEGLVTERQYLDGFTNHCANPRVRIKIAPEHGTPKTLVEVAKTYKVDAEKSAKRERDDNIAYDAVWCVFDVDEHPLIPDAVQMARDNEIKLAISNPSFELWLLLHHRVSPGMKGRQQVRALLKRFVADYDKKVDFEKHCAAGYERAVVRARALHDRASKLGESHHDDNPSTGVYVLTESIRDGRPLPAVSRPA